jgi:hypothetical protein
MFNNDNVNDCYGSQDELYTKIKKFIPKNKIVYEPFYLDGKSGECLKKMGCKKVIHEDIDFFTNVDKIQYDIIISNPPFSKRKLILDKLFEIDKPFILTLFPIVLSCKWFLKNYGNKNLQLIIPQTRSKCYNPILNKINYTPPMGMFYFCFKCNFENDLNFI